MYGNKIRSGRIHPNNVQIFKDIGYDVRYPDRYPDGSFDNFWFLDRSDGGLTYHPTNGYFTSIDQATLYLVDLKLSK